MKSNSYFIFGGVFLLVLGLTGCGPSDKPVGKASAAPTASAVATDSGQTKPGHIRTVSITANDAMKFSLTEIRAKPGEALAVTLTNQGTAPKAAMGHNWVLLLAGTDLNAFATAAVTAIATDYIPESFKDRVLASTKLLGPKESDTVHFNAPKAPGRYPFLCAFPGHMQAGMKGELIVE